MGYTHYFKQTKDVDDKAWEQICKFTKKILKQEIEKGIPLESNGTSKTMVSKKSGFINFNGVDDETFLVEQRSDKQFNFTKTARRPYDMAVMRTLLIIEHFAPQHFDIGSDGSAEEWIPAALENKKELNTGYMIPERIDEVGAKEFNIKMRDMEITEKKEKLDKKIENKVETKIKSKL